MNNIPKSIVIPKMKNLYVLVACLEVKWTFIGTLRCRMLMEVLCEQRKKVQTRLFREIKAIGPASPGPAAIKPIIKMPSTFKPLLQKP